MCSGVTTDVIAIKLRMKNVARGSKRKPPSHTRSNIDGARMRGLDSGEVNPF